VAPPPESVDVLPAHTKVGEAIPITGKGAILIVVREVLVPHPFCPTMVYVVVALGVKATLLLMPPENVYVNAPAADIDTVLPRQTVGDEGVIVKTGAAALTVMVIAALVIQLDGLMAVKL